MGHTSPLAAYVLIDGKPVKLHKGDKIRDFRNGEWTFDSVHHSRKLTVTDDSVKPGEWFHQREFYASVFKAGIRHEPLQMWTFSPEWDKDGTFDPNYTHDSEPIGSADLGESVIVW